MTDVLRPDLWNLVKPVLGPARTAGAAYIAAGRWVEKSDAREYRESDHGWPLVLAERMFAEGPPKWTSLFSLEKDRFSKVLVADVPEFSTALDEVVAAAESDRSLFDGLSYFPWDVDDERRDRHLRVAFMLVVGEILGRAEALALTTNEDLFDLYRKVERGKFTPSLSGDFMVPLVMTTFEATEPVHLVDDYWLEPMTVDEHRARALGTHSNVSHLIAAAATHAVVRRETPFVNPEGPDASTGTGYDVSEVLTFTHHVLEAIHIATGKKSGYAQVLIRSDEWVSDFGWLADLPHLCKAATVNGYPADFDGGWRRPKDPITNDELGTVQSVLRSLLTAPRNVQLAARRCLRTTYREDVEDEILDATIGIEALLSAEKDELTHRMSLRAAVALAGEFRSEAVYALLKQVYAQRSQIVHGETPKKSYVKFEESEFSTNHIGVFLLRNLLKSCLVAETPWTPASLDAVIVRRLGVTERPTEDEPEPDDADADGT